MEIGRIRALIIDMRDDFNSLKDRLQKCEDSNEAFSRETREKFESFQKVTDTLDVQIIAVKKLIARLSEKVDSTPVQSRTNLLAMKTDNADSGDDKLGKLRIEFDAFQTSCQRTFKDH